MQLANTFRARGICIFRLISCFVLFFSISPSKVGCEEVVPQLDFAWHHDLRFVDMIQSSSIIVIGQVKSLDYLGSSVTATDDRGNHGDWQLLRVRTSVENILKGRVEGNLIDFYFYVWLGGAVGDWNALHIADRCVFFLTVSNGVLRAVRDYERSSIEVGTGRHAKTPAGASIQERIAILLLTPGDNLEPRRFRRVLLRVVPVVVSWIGPCRTSMLLKPLLQNSARTVAESAREQLAILSAEQDPCSAR